MFLFRKCTKLNVLLTCMHEPKTTSETEGVTNNNYKYNTILTHFPKII